MKVGEENLYTAKWYIRLLTYLVFSLFVRYYRIRHTLPPEVKDLWGPYLLLGNHVGYWDPFIIGHFLPEFTHFVSSEAAFRSKIAGFFLPRLGVIPIRKNMRDIKVIRDMANMIQHGKNIGIFPEGTRNWAGSTLPIDPSIGKLIKFLGVPVIVSVSRGMNLFNPRWSRYLRKTYVEVEYKLLFNKEDIELKSASTIYAEIVKNLEHDEVDYQRMHRHPIRSSRRAEHISHTLFVCPRCERIDTFDCTHNTFSCSECANTIEVDEFGFFVAVTNSASQFDNIRDWYHWQLEWMQSHIYHLFIENYSGVIFQDRQSNVFKGTQDQKLSHRGKADIKLFIDRIEMHFLKSAEVEILYLKHLNTINPQVNEKLEIIFEDHIYRCTGDKRGVSGLKWEVAVNIIWRLTGQNFKCSSYIPLSRD